MPKVSSSRFVPESAAVLFCQFVADKGGYSSGRWVENTMRLRITGISRGLVRSAVNAIVRVIVQKKLSLTLIEMLGKADTIPALSAGNVLELRLSKRLLFLLPYGVRIERPSCKGQHSFKTKLRSNVTRAAIWHRAVAFGADYRLCRVCWPKGPSAAYWLKGKSGPRSE